MTSTLINSLNRRLPLCLTVCRYVSTNSPVRCVVYDLVIVGGGIVGCATAREMLVRHPNLKIAIMEKEKDVALHQTGHNSGVVHAGIYYKPGSIKAKLCVEGMQLSYDYFCKHDIPHKKIGKFIVAKNQHEVGRLNEFYENALKNNVPNVELVDKECMQNYEPKCKGEKALWSPWTGIVDWGLVCRSFADEFKKMGGKIFLNYEVTGFAENVESQGSNEYAPISIISKNKTIFTKYALTCAGLQSDRLAVMTGCDSNPRIIPFRGEYLVLKDDKKHLCTTNIYPVPDAKYPFLGVHFTPRMNGDIWLGPNAVLALAREGYSWKDVNIKDCIELFSSPGFYKYAFKHVVPGVKEMIKSIYYPLAVKEAQHMLPDVTVQDLKRGPAGVRAQALSDDGKLVDDFVFDGGKGSIGSRVMHVRNAPSPAATSSMAIAKFISNKIETDFKF